MIAAPSLSALLTQLLAAPAPTLLEQEGFSAMLADLPLENGPKADDSAKEEGAALTALANPFVPWQMEAAPRTPLPPEAFSGFQAAEQPVREKFPAPSLPDNGPAEGPVISEAPARSEEPFEPAVAPVQRPAAKPPGVLKESGSHAGTMEKAESEKFEIPVPEAKPARVFAPRPAPPEQRLVIALENTPEPQPVEAPVSGVNSEPEAPHESPARLEEAVEKIVEEVEGLRAHRSEESRELRFRLWPRELGKLEVRIERSGEDLAVELVAESSETSGFMEEHREELERALDEKWSSGGIDVFVKNSRDGGRQTPGESGKRRPEPFQETSHIPEPRNSRGGLSVYL